MKSIKEKIINAPITPGVYLFKDRKNRPLYIGKAVNLKKRLNSYLKNEDPKIRILMQRAVDIEVIPTNSDVEALTLEESLIKLNKPKYNVRLKDDKKFPYLKITVKEEFPGIYVTRHIKSDGNALFGPYTSARALRQTVNAVSRVFGLRTCKFALPSKKIKRPCLKFILKRCAGPCVGQISPADYRKLVDEVILFLNGKSHLLEEEVEKKMWAAAREENYESAKYLRDHLQAIRLIQQRQAIVSRDNIDRDVLGLAHTENLASLALFKIRENRLVAREIYKLAINPASTDSEILAAFIRSHYLHQTYFPDEILLPIRPDDFSTLVRWFKLKNSNVKLTVGRFHEPKVLTDWAQQNAEIELLQDRAVRLIPTSLSALAKVLRLDHPPRWIEAFDVSNIMGDSAVGASVSFKDGRPDRSNYRRFRIKRVQGQNDFAMIREIVNRRLAQFIGEKPDLLLIDGGKGQLSSARQAIKELNLEIPVLAFAKRSDQLYYKIDQIVSIPCSSPALKLLRYIRNEAHRFAITYHRKLRGRKIKSSILDRIPGLGPKKKIELLRHFGSIKNMTGASREEISKVRGIRKKIAEEIYNTLHS